MNAADPLHSFAPIGAEFEAIDGMMGVASAHLFHMFLDAQYGVVTGPLIETGAYKGKSAIVLANHLQEGERLDLVDIYPHLDTTAFARFGDAVQLRLGSSDDLERLIPNYGSLRGRYRFFHADASHSFSNVVNDVVRADALLHPRGILAVDDYENPNYPQVPLAVGQAIYGRQLALTPFLVANNKLYLCRPAERDKALAYVFEVVAPVMRREHRFILACTDADDRAPITLRPAEFGEDGDIYAPAIYSDTVAVRRMLLPRKDNAWYRLLRRLFKSSPTNTMSLKPDYASTREDVAAAFKKWRIWTHTGWNDVKRRYRRTILGPLWNTLSLAFLAAAMTYVWAPLMNADVLTFLPWVVSGVVCWTFLSTMIGNAGYLFTGSEGLLKQLKFPLSILAFSALWRDLIVFFHNLVIVFIIVVVLNVPVNTNTLLFIPGLALVALNALWFTPLIALLSTRFRDVPPLLSSILTVLYFVTPVFWRPEQLAGRSFLYDVNYLHHLLDVIRSPMLGRAPDPLSYVVTIASLVLGSIVTFVAFAYLRRRVTYWL